MLEDVIKITDSSFLPLREVVFNTLRHAILRGDLTPGERLMEVKLADMMGVSRTPVREALRRLESEGLVQMIPRRGAVVAHIDEKRMTDVLVVRKALEELAIQIACDNMTRTDIERLKEVTEALELAIDRNNIDKIADLDVKFHDIIFNATDNLRLIQILNNLRDQMFRYRLEYIKVKSEHESVLREHKAIIKALEEHDTITASDVIKTHIDKQGEIVKKEIKEIQTKRKKLK